MHPREQWRSSLQRFVKPAEPIENELNGERGKDDPEDARHDPHLTFAETVDNPLGGFENHPGDEKYAAEDDRKERNANIAGVGLIVEQ